MLYILSVPCIFVSFILHLDNRVPTLFLLILLGGRWMCRQTFSTLLDALVRGRWDEGPSSKGSSVFPLLFHGPPVRKRRRNFVL